MNDYAGMSAREGGKIQVYAQIVGDTVEMLSNEKGNLIVSFDPKSAQVSGKIT